MDAEELRNNTATEDDTAGFNKKRGRRVSFAAEMTSVHVFDRDEDIETPPEPKPDSDPVDVVLGFFKDFQDSDDSRDRNQDGNDDDDDDEYGRQPFLQPFESPSPGSTFGSATSDEDAFFGPVSSEFIRPGRFSDSVASDDNHEITMDSTAFSMHFQSLVRSESGDLKTPSGSRLVFEEKTPTQSGTATAPGSSMELTSYEKSVPHKLTPADKLGSGKDSNDMSLVEDNPRKYDYASISPILDELMSDENDFLHGAFTSKSSDSVNATYDSDKLSRDTCIQTRLISLEGAQAPDLGDHSVHDIIREEPLATPHTPVHILVSDSLLYRDLVAEQPSENKHSLSSQQIGVREITEVIGSNHVEALMPSISNSSPAELSSPVPSFGLFTLKEHNHVHSRGDNSYEKLQSRSPAIPYPSTLVEQPENRREGRRHESDTLHCIGMHNQSPPAVISSVVSGMKAQLAMDSSNSSGLGKIMPATKFGGSLVKQAGTDTNVINSTKQESIPRLMNEGICSISCTPVVEDGSMRSKLYSYIVKTPRHDTPLTRLENKFLDIDHGQHVQKMTADEDGSEFLTPVCRKSSPIDELIKVKARKNISSQLTDHVEEESQSFSTLKTLSDEATMKSGNSSSYLKLTHRVRSDNKLTRIPDRIVYSQNQSLGIGLSPLHNDCTLDKLAGSSCRLNNDVVQSYDTVINPSLLKISYHDTGNKMNDTLDKVLASQKKSSSARSPSARYEDILHVELTHQSHSDDAIRVSPGKDGDSMEIISSGNYLNVVAQKLDNLFLGQNLYSGSPLLVTDIVKSPLQAQLGGDIKGLNQHNTGMFQIPSKNEAILSASGNIASSVGFVTLDGHASVNESPISKVRSETTEYSLGRKHDTIEKDEMHVYKRGRDEVFTGSEGSTPNVDQPRSPKIKKTRVSESENQTAFSDDRISRSGSIVTPRHWSAMLSEVVANSEQLRPKSVDMLDLLKIDLLEDVLGQMQKIRGFSRLCVSIQSQCVRNPISLAKNTRITETKELLQDMLYEQAKLKLLSVKRENLLKRVEFIRTGVRNCQTMKLNYSEMHERVKTSVKVGNTDSQSVQEFEDEIQNMRQKVGTSQRDIDSLIYYFYKCFKMKEKPTHADTIVLINDHLKRKRLMKSLREDLQLWDIDDVVYKKSQNQIILNYHGYLIQRFTLLAPTSVVTVSYMLSHLNIEKKYPKMDAPVAFSFAFKVNTEKKYFGIRSLVQETQATSSIFSSLLDVIEEVKFARVELNNMMDAKFLSPSAEKLDLCLRFFDFKTSMEIIMALDVSCVIRGIYPSDVLPFQLQSHHLLTKISLPAHIQAALESLKFGFSRIIRLCRCISETLAGPS
uniref:Uncharacterized protein n=1 Tax=Kalanchoe fedtschenkoi TaxID=63787 RepID=A0A7N0TVN5_KALFE